MIKKGIREEEKINIYSKRIKEMGRNGQKERRETKYRKIGGIFSKK